MNPLEVSEDTLVYQKIARKDKSFWLLFHPNSDDYKEIYMFLETDKHLRVSDNSIIKISEADYEIHWWDIDAIGHKIILSDVLFYIRHLYDSSEEWYSNAIDYEETNIRKYWELSKPTYEEQSEECKSYIRNLI